MEREGRSIEAPAGLENYPGSKSHSSCYPVIIGQLPKHRVYVEGFAGGAGIYRAKRRCELSILVDRDERVCEAWRRSSAELAPESVVARCFLEWVEDPGSHQEAMEDPGTLVYLDPPYLEGTVSRSYYAEGFGSELQHRCLLRWALAAGCRVAISGYWSELYEKELAGWRCVRFWTSTRGGLRQECLWMNYPEGLPLHDTRYAGANFRERERTKRRAASWASMYRAMGSGERSRVLEALLAVEGEGGH